MKRQDFTSQMARDPNCCFKAPFSAGDIIPSMYDGCSDWTPTREALHSPMSTLSSGRPPAEGPVQRPLLFVLGLWEGET